MLKKDYREFLEVLQRNLPEKAQVAVRILADAFVDYATKAQKYNLQACNVGLTPEQQEDSDSLDASVKGLAVYLGFGYELQGDPRGCPIRLIFPDGTCNSFGGVGYCVPRNGR